jgi:hypothetical protein
MAPTLVFADFRSALKSLRGRVSDRKFRLLAVAACRHIYPAAGLTPEWEAAVAVIERFADAEADGQELAREQSASLARAHGIRAGGLAGNLNWWSAWLHEEIIRGATQTSGCAAAWTCAAKSLAACSNEIGEEMRRAPERMVDLLYDICGYLNCAGSFDPGWRAPDVLRLASAIYRARAFADLPVLADALEEAGCADEVILGHLRGPGPHVRGCWPLDLVLGKE